MASIGWNILKIGIYFVIPIAFIAIVPIVFRVLKIESDLALRLAVILLVIAIVSSMFLINRELDELSNNIYTLYVEMPETRKPVMDSLFDNTISDNQQE